MSDPTESIRREMVEKMPEQLRLRQEAGEKLWDTGEFMADFEVRGFLAPFVMVTRKSDGRTGTMMFNHSPRYYFEFQGD